MQRTLTCFGLTCFGLTCFGLLILIALGGPLEGFAQDTGVRRNLRADDAQRDGSKKSATGGFWSSTSKWRQRLLPFSADKEASENESIKRERQSDAGSGKLRSAAEKNTTIRRGEIAPKQINSETPTDARDLVTMPAISGPPAVSRPVNRTDRSKAVATTTREKSRPNETPPLSVNRAVNRAVNRDNPSRSGQRPTVSRSFVPTTDSREPVATADIRDGKSSRRSSRLSRTEQKVPAAPASTVASQSPQQSDKKSQAKPVFASGRPATNAVSTASSEVRASDRQADKRSAISSDSNRRPSTRAFTPKANTTTVRTVEQSRATITSRSKQQNLSSREGVTTKVKAVDAGSTSGNRSEQESVVTAAAAARASNSSSRASRVNPLVVDRSAKNARRHDILENPQRKSATANRPARVSSRLTSQTVGGELGGSLLFSKGPQLSVETLGPSQVVIGKEAIFKIRLRNLGDPVAESVLLRINTPLGAQIVSAQPSRGQTNALAAAKQKPLEWRLDRLEAHATEFLTLRIVPRKSDSFDLGVTWTLAPIASQARIKVQEPKLNLEIIGPHEIDYGDTKLYRLTITNPGNGVAENVQLKLKPLDGSSRPMAVRDVGSIEPGAKQVMEVELTARQIGYLNVEAVVVADTDLKTSARQRVLIRRAQLAVAAKGPEMNYAGTTATYRFQVDNQGNSSAKNIRVIATLPTGGDYLDSSDQGEWNPETRQVVWKVPALVAQNDQSFEVRVSLSHPGENLFGVRLSADDDLAASSEVKTFVEALADLQLVINDPRGPVPVEEETTYEVLISNRGTKAAEMVDVVVFFSEGIEPISVVGGSAKVNTGQVIFHPIEQIAPGEDVVYKIAARANSSGNHVFRTEVACEEADVRLMAEESTRFYGSSSVKKQARPEKVPSAREVEKSGAAGEDLPEYRRKKS